MSNKKITPNLAVQRPSNLFPLEVPPVVVDDADEHDDGRSDEKDAETAPVKRPRGRPRNDGLPAGSGPDSAKRKPEKNHRRAAAGAKRPVGRPKTDVQYERVSYRLRQDVLTKINFYLVTRHGMTREEVINTALDEWLRTQTKKGEAKKAKSQKSK